MWRGSTVSALNESNEVGNDDGDGTVSELNLSASIAVSN